MELSKKVGGNNSVLYIVLIGEEKKRKENTFDCFPSFIFD